MYMLWTGQLSWKAFGFSTRPGHTLRSCRRAPGATAAAAATLHRAGRVFGDVRAGAAGVVLETAPPALFWSSTYIYIYNYML